MLSKQESTRKRSTQRERTLDAVQAFRLHSADNRRYVENFFIALGTPVALSCYLLYKSGEYDQLVSKGIQPAHYNEPTKFRDDFAAVSFMRKHKTLKTTFDKKGDALRSFVDAEKQCKESNNRVRSYLQGHFQKDLDERVLSGTIGKISRILGTFDIDDVIDNCRWGPGSTQAVKGQDCSGARKFDIDRDVTADAYYLFGDILKLAYPSWAGVHEPNFVVGNMIDTVPKNAKTDRVIAVEPGINSWIQGGIGRLIRKRLRFSGFNLNSDLKNQRGAYIGSLDDSLATVDFKAASDTISREVMSLLLPPVWYEAMNAARSKNYTLGNETLRAEKFSTMGNGFTFELESLIFLSVALAICEIDGVDDSGVSIFGDDLILPSTCVAKLTLFCSFIGFTINGDKTFSSGPFRESCGSYYFDGLDVKPLYNREDLVDSKQIYRAANSIRWLAHRRQSSDGCEKAFRPIWSLLCHLLPSVLRLFGPVAGGDAVIHGNISEGRPLDNPEGWCGSFYTGLPLVANDIDKDSPGLLLARLMKRHDGSVFLASLRGSTRITFDLRGRRTRIVDQETSIVAEERLGNRALSNSVSLKDSTRVIFKRRMFVHLWYEFGDWV